MTASINLDDLNSDVARKLRKFDTSNDGTLSNDELISGIITLQKQSDSYKKMVWMLIPLLALLIISIFGMTILAIKITKEITVSNNQLLTTSGDIIQTAPAYQERLEFNYLNTNVSGENTPTKNIKITPGSFKKSETIGFCVFKSTSQTYLSFKNGYYALIKDIELIDVLYLQDLIPFANYDYSISQRLWFKDSGNYYIRFQIKSLSCPVSFVFICDTSELQFRLDGDCQDKNILDQYYLYMGTPFSEDNIDEEYFTGGKSSIKPTIPQTKIVSIKASSYTNCVNGCKASI